MPQSMQWQLLIALICGFVISHWMLWPLSKRAEVLRLPTRLALIDLLGLMVLLQVAAAVYAFFHLQEPLVPFRAFILAVNLLFVLTLWGASLSVVSQVGITHSLPRAVVMLVLVPGALVVMVAPLVLLVWLYLVGPGQRVVLVSPGFLSGMAVVVLAAIGMRYLASWTLGSAPSNAPDGRLA